MTRDRAAVVTTAIISIVVDELRRWLHGDLSDLAGARVQIENMLRDEFADLTRQAAGERRDPIDFP